MMVEGEGKECEEAGLVKAIEVAHEAIRAQVKLQLELREKAGVTGKREYAKPYTNPELEAKIAEFASKRIYEVSKGALGKHERSDAFKAIKEEYKAQFQSANAEEANYMSPEDAALIGTYFHDLEKKVIRDMMLNERGWDRAGWSTDATSGLVGDAQVGVGWRKGDSQASFGVIHREVKGRHMIFGQLTRDDTVAALNFSIRPGR